MDTAPKPDPTYSPDPRAARSMAAFDAMPKAFRVFCANYPRTANGMALANLLADCDGRVIAAANRLRELMPVRGT